MKLAVITPPKGLALISDYELGYHMVLPQYMHNDDYSFFYQRMSRAGHFIMVDNGAAEGVSVVWPEVLNVAERLAANEIVMPDVLDKAEETWLATSRVLDTVAPCRRAMCPQGRTWAEWERCLERMVNAGCATICIAKRYEKFPGGRLRGVEIIVRHLWHWNHNIHFLGIYKDPIDEIMVALRAITEGHAQYLIRGIDTAAPIAYAQVDKTLSAPQHYSLDWDAPFDMKLASKNVGTLLSVVNGWR